MRCSTRSYSLTIVQSKERLVKLQCDDATHSEENMLQRELVRLRSSMNDATSQVETDTINRLIALVNARSEKHKYVCCWPRLRS